ncbi:MAG: NAD(P)-dependent alcohol dehydrogenase [Acidobacteria bacterium]|nr:NAD(P)-dependent alcohol dehydrogenase [Acidobacteriota bacterium]
MKAYQIEEFGLDGLRIADRPKPEPGPRQVLIRMQAWSLNYRDLLTAKGLYNPRLKMPRIPFSDGAGEVVAVGTEVTSVKPGDRVTSTFFEGWKSGAATDATARTALGAEREGVLAEYAALDEDGVIPMPAHLTYAEASTLPCAALTAWNALVAEGKINSGDTILTLGTGGVSIFALQFARMHGARVVITSSSDEKLAKARQLGAVHTINYKNTPDWGKKVREFAGGRGVDLVVEVGGGGTFNQSAAALRRGGTMSLIGVLASGGGANVLSILMNGIRVQGIFVGSGEMFAAMNRAVEANQMHPVIDRIFAFDKAREALEYMESARHFGKICIQI